MVHKSDDNQTAVVGILYEYGRHDTFLEEVWMVFSCCVCCCVHISSLIREQYIIICIIIYCLSDDRTQISYSNLVAVFM